MLFWKDFCEEHKGFGGHTRFSIQKLNFDNNNVDKLKEKHFQSLWNDFCGLRMFIETQVISKFSPLIKKYAIIQNYFQFDFKRSRVGCLKANNHGNDNHHAPLKSLILFICNLLDIDNGNKSEEKRLLKLLLRYLVVWNGILLLFINDDTDGGHREFCSDNNFPHTNKDLEQYFQLYLQSKLNKIVMNCNVKGFDAKGLKLNESISSDLSKFCIQDISDIETFSKEFDNVYNCGISHFFINRLSYIICFDNESYQDKKLKVDSKNFGNLKDVLLLFGIYNLVYVTFFRCYKKVFDESFVIFALLSLTKHLNIKSLLNGRGLVYLRNINYCQGYTLLHSAVQWTMPHYAQLLITPHAEYRFDMMKHVCKFQQGGSQKGKTCYDMVKSQNSNKLTRLFESMMNTEEKKENDKPGSQTASEIESAYNQLSKQVSFARHLLLQFGCKFNPRDIGITKTQPPTNTSYSTKNYQNDLYYDWSQLSYHNGNTANKKGKKNKTGKNIKNMKNSKNTASDNNNSIKNNKNVEAIINSTISMIQSKFPLCDDLLILCLTYLNECQSNKSDLLLNRFIAAIQQCGKECLNNKFMNKKTKYRDYYWFKTYLLKSNIWLMPVRSLTTTSNSPNSRKKDKKEKEMIMYDMINQIMDDALIQQKRFIWQSCNKEKQNDGKSWNDLLNVKSTTMIDSLRQDVILHGITPDLTYNELLINAPKVPRSNGFDIFDIANTQNYLSKLLIFAQMMNQTFQNDVSKLFDHISMTQGFSCNYQTAPVKLSQRCVIKAQTGTSFGVLFQIKQTLFVPRKKILFFLFWIVLI